MDQAGEKRKEEERQLAELQRRLEAVRRKFERFFMGLDRVVPGAERDRLARDLRNSPLVRARNTSLRFRFNNITQRYASLSRNWDRQLRVREEGSP